MKPLGLHILIDLAKIDSGKLNDPETLQRILEKAARDGGATVLESKFRRFEPQGISGVVIISESHITCHTWPEHDYAAIDVFTCGDETVGEMIVQKIIQAFSPGEYTLSRHHRSLPTPTPKAVNR